MYSFKRDSHCAGCLQLFECRYCCVFSVLKLLLTLAPKPDYHSSVGQTQTHTHTHFCAFPLLYKRPAPSRRRQTTSDLCAIETPVWSAVSPRGNSCLLRRKSHGRNLSALTLSTIAVSQIVSHSKPFFVLKKKSNVYACKSFVTVTPRISSVSLSLSASTSHKLHKVPMKRTYKGKRYTDLMKLHYAALRKDMFFIHGHFILKNSEVKGLFFFFFFSFFERVRAMSSLLGE